ncbi:MAG: M28 family peptidase, partial [Chloroflexota bacterium]|nr:M28 family peptidase [Chloroflexota bacterium]
MRRSSAGLLGSIYYVEHPSYPLTSTVAMLQLDMVGVSDGGTLHIEGAGSLADQLTISAENLGINTTITDSGGSDHVPFQRRGIPASLLIWFDEAADATYHTAADVPATIIPDNLRSVGELTTYTLLVLGECQVDVERTVARMAEAVIQDDAAGYVALADATDEDFLAQQEHWFAEMHSLPLEQFELTAGQILVDREQATVTLGLRYSWSEESGVERFSFPARFVRRDGQWRYAGLAVQTAQSEHFSIGHLSTVNGTEWAESADRIYLSLIEELGLPPQTGMRVLLFPKNEVLGHLTQPTAPQVTTWIPSGRTAWVVASTPITTVVTQLALNQTGLPADALPWLRVGLPLILADQDAGDTSILPLLTSTATPSPAGNFPSPDASGDEEARLLRSQARSMTAYLLEKHGWDAIHTLGEVWARTGDGETAFRQALGLSSAEFTAAWQADVLQPARQAKADIEALVARRQEVIVAGDGDALLATVDPTNPTLVHETEHWAADLARRPAKEYTTDAILHTLTGDRAEVGLHIDYVGGGYKGRLNYEALFVRRDGQWFYGGLAWQTLSDDRFLIKYQNRDEEWAQGVLDAADRAYEHVSGVLPLSTDSRLEIELYSSPLTFRPSVMLSLPPWMRQWAEPGGSLKLVAQEDDPQRYAAPLAGAFARMALSQMGVEDTFLREGLAEFLAAQMEPLGPQEVAARYVPILQKALGRQATFPFDQMPDPLSSDEEQAQLIYAQSWSGVTYFEELFGREPLLDL